MNPQDLRKQAMKIRHPTFTGTLSDDQRQVVGDTADMLMQAANVVEKAANLADLCREERTKASPGDWTLSYSEGYNDGLEQVEGWLT